MTKVEKIRQFLSDYMVVNHKPNKMMILGTTAIPLWQKFCHSTELFLEHHNLLHNLLGAYSYAWEVGGPDFDVCCANS